MIIKGYITKVDGNYIFLEDTKIKILSSTKITIKGYNWDNLIDLKGVYVIINCKNKIYKIEDQDILWDILQKKNYKDINIIEAKTIKN